MISDGGNIVYVVGPRCELALGASITEPATLGRSVAFGQLYVKTGLISPVQNAFRYYA